MRAKGTAIRITPKFVKTKFPDRYQEWFDSLPEKSKQIFSNPILGNQWYPVNEGIIIPTTKVAELFYDSVKEAAFEIGRFSAFDALTGIYKIFVKVASINFIIKRAPTIFSTYYDRGKLEVVKNEKGYAVLRLTQLEEKNDVILYRTAGWMSAVPEVINIGKGKVEFSKKYDGPFLDVIFTVSWSEGNENK